MFARIRLKLEESKVFEMVDAPVVEKNKQRIVLFMRDTAIFAIVVGVFQ